MAFNKAQMSKEFRKALDANEFYSRLAPTSHYGAPHMYHVTKIGSSLDPVRVWVEASRFTIFEGQYNETHISELSEVIEHLKSCKWDI